MHNFFFKRNIYIQILSIKKLYVFLLIKNNQNFIFNKNYFYKNWNQNKKIKILIKYILPLENIEIIQNINLNKR